MYRKCTVNVKQDIFIETFLHRACMPMEDWRIAEHCFAAQLLQSLRLSPSRLVPFGPTEKHTTAPPPLQRWLGCTDLYCVCGQSTLTYLPYMNLPLLQLPRDRVNVDNKFGSGANLYHPGAWTPCTGGILAGRAAK